MMSFPPDYFAGKKVTIMGLGHFGGQIAVIKYLASQGAVITVTDVAPAEKLGKSLQEISGIPVTLHLGGHLESDFTEADLIVISPAVHKDSRYLKLAAQNDIPFTCEMNLFLDRCRGKVAAITGTVGKSTTTAMVEAIMSRAGEELSRLGHRKAWCGGNIGRSLLEDLPQIQPDDLVVLELSSFQLEDLAGIEYSPHIALVTNIYPNHLDRHKTLDGYIEAKANITRFQMPGDFLIVRQDDEGAAKLRELAPDSVTKWQFGTGGGEGLKVRLMDGGDGHILVEYLREETGLWEKLVSDEELRVPGEHNLYNAAGAVALCLAIGLSGEVIGTGLREFKGLSDRLELVGELNGVRWFNDSKSTTPESGMVALKAFREGSIVAIAGGYDKGSDLTQFAQLLAQRTAKTYCLGQTGENLANLISRFAGQAQLVGSLEDAVACSCEHVQSGQVVLLSPGCASWDMFENYQQRGRVFSERVQRFINGKHGSELQATCG